MYSLIFRVRVTAPPQYGRNGTVRGVFASTRSVRVRHACDVRWAWRITGLDSATHFHSIAVATQPVYQLQIRPIVHN